MRQVSYFSAHFPYFEKTKGRLRAHLPVYLSIRLSVHPFVSICLCIFPFLLERFILLSLCLCPPPNFLVFCEVRVTASVV
jgi:hypothetical protein